jgi:hypothetical protein
LSNAVNENAWLAISLRPYNPEGVSFIHNIQELKDGPGWKINNKDIVHFDQNSDENYFSYYRHGDAYSVLFKPQEKTKETFCTVGMATAVALFKLDSKREKNVTLHIPLQANNLGKPSSNELALACQSWKQSFNGYCKAEIPDKHFQFLYDTAIATLILHTPKETYPGPYTYKQFWFRDAAIILYAMTMIGLKDRAKRALDCFPSRQNKFGYYLSQDGEWDANGEAMWALQKYCQMTNSKPSQAWLTSVRKGAGWICRKRTSNDSPLAHAGLFPAGFSAEHLGPNDFYYWDDFWGIAGLEAASYFEKHYGKQELAIRYNKEAADFLNQTNLSLSQVEKRLEQKIMPAAPYRRMDAGAIGSIAASYPLQVFPKNDPRVLNTVHYLVENCFIDNGFFHDMTHSGINPYLTLDIAQVMLRAGDRRFFDLMTAIAQLASPTGQWPEAIHPLTKGGCMGDGQHVWAAAEWILLVRNCFLREEEKDKKLILCSGIPSHWLKDDERISFGTALTIYGSIDLAIVINNENVTVSWKAQWHDSPPNIEIHLADYPVHVVKPNETSVKFPKRF